MLTRLSFVFAMLAGCSFIIDTNETQCSTDSDCSQFGSNHPFCQQGVCVDSMLGPPGCFFGTPMQPSDFANQCTTAQTFQYDNCKNLNLCDATSLTNAMTTMIAPTPGVDAGKATAPVTTQPTPTVNCADLAADGVASAVMYITGSTNLPPLIKAVQPLLYTAAPSYVAVFAPQTSCAGAASIYDPDVTKHVIHDAANNFAFYYDTSGNQQFCLLGSAGQPVDVGESDVYPTTCGYAENASSFGDYTGPIQAITFVVPSASSQKVISAEAAHLVFGAGANNNQVLPWTNPQLYFVRSSGTGTVQLPSKAIQVMPTMWWGFDQLSAGNLVETMESVVPSDAEASIGVLSNDFADRSRGNLTTLAFQQAGESYGYLPDSSPTSTDKMNVRDGHYPMWGAIHLLATITNGQPSAAAKALITQFTLSKLDMNLVAAIIAAGFIPQCAMAVNHTTEVGTLASLAPTSACDCFFLSQTKSPLPAACVTCMGASDCPSSRPACSYGYCEPQ